MDETIEVTSVEIKTRKPVQIGAAYHRKLEILAGEQRRSMTGQVEVWIEEAWQRAHPQPLTEAEALQKACEQ